MQAIALSGLVRIDLPGGTVLRLSEGAEIRWGAETYVPRHATYGAVQSVAALAEGIGNEVPALVMVLAVPDITAAAALVQPGAQQSRVRVWLAEIDLDAASVTGTPDLIFDGFLDQSFFKRRGGVPSLEISVVSLLERLFELNIGNSLSPTFHKAVWPGETGEDHATGLALPDAWGVEAPPRGGGYFGGGAGGGGGGWFDSGRMAHR
jgi:hypothetical protein